MFAVFYFVMELQCLHLHGSAITLVETLKYASTKAK